jgi:hypothetical protein
MDNERIGNRLFDPIEIQQVFRRGIGPALHTLPSGDLGHDDAQEITSVPALAHDFFVDGSLFKAGTRVEAALIPCLQQPPLVARDREISERRLQQIDRVGLYPVYREVSC